MPGFFGIVRTERELAEIFGRRVDSEGMLVMTRYESWLRAACKNALIPGFMTKSINVLLELKKKALHWKMWNTKT